MMSTSTAILFTIAATLNFVQRQLDYLETQVKIQEEQRQEQELADFILECESRGNPMARSKPEHKDGTPSFGLYQFHFKTFQVYAEKYLILPKATKLTYQETIPYLYNPRYNSAVARAMLADGLYSHWKNCSDRYFKLSLR